jgi:putative SbcD/Mre11-related phosphoesterase
MRVHTDWLLTPARAAVYGPTATAVVADLHLGYGVARQHAGEAVPVAGAAEVVAALAPLVADYGIRRLVIAGDLVEEGRDGGEVQELLDWLDRVGVALAAVVPGNHDRGLARAGGRLPFCPDGIQLGRWHVVHGDGRLPRGPTLHGHWHPCLRWTGRLAAPCYLVGPRRIVLPAFSADAAGANVLGDRHWRGYRCHVIVGSEVLDFGEVTWLQRQKEKGKRQKA